MNVTRLWCSYGRMQQMVEGRNTSGLSEEFGAYDADETDDGIDAGLLRMWQLPTLSMLLSLKMRDYAQQQGSK